MLVASRHRNTPSVRYEERITKGFDSTAPTRAQACFRYDRAHPPAPRRNDVLLGLREPFLWFLSPLFILVCVGVTITVSKISFIATAGINALCNKVPSFPWLRAMQWLDRRAPWLAGVFRWTGSWWSTDSRYLILRA